MQIYKKNVKKPKKSGIFFTINIKKIKKIPIIVKNNWDKNTMI
jgi:hypothetical protein